MPRLLNPKHEAIAVSLSEGASQTKAYAKAYQLTNEKGAKSSAARLMRNARHGPPIRARADELRSLENAKERAVLEFSADLSAPVTNDWIMRQLVGVVVKAGQSGNLASVTKALELLGRERGMFQVKKDGAGRFRLDQLTKEDLDQLIVELEGDPEVVAAMAESTALSASPPAEDDTQA